MKTELNSSKMGDTEVKEEAVGGSSHVLNKSESAERYQKVKLRKKQGHKNKQHQKRNVESIKIQIHRVSDFEFVERWQTWEPIFLAVYLCEVEKLSSLLRDPETKVDTTDEKGNTALHYAVLTACLFRDTHTKSYKCMDLLMSQHIKMNTPNKKGYTAIALSVRHHHRTCVEHMLKHPSANHLYLDYYAGDSENTVREIIMQTYPDLQPILPAPLMERLDSPDRDIKLLAALQHDEYKTFHVTHDPNNPDPWYDEPYYSTLLEIACQMKDRKEFVEVLLQNGADPNIKNRVTGMPLIHATVRSGNFEVLELLLKKGETTLKDNENRTILHQLAGVSERKPGDKQKIKCAIEDVLCCDHNPNVGIDDRDSSGNTALCTAVERGLQNRATLLLNKGADIMVFENGSKVLLSASLKMMNDILDDCLESNDKPVTSKNYALNLEYGVLKNIVPRMAEGQHLRDLLRHPVISTFLRFKWQNVKYIYFIYLAFYIIYVLSVTAYILYFECYNTQNVMSADTSTTIFPLSNDSDKTSYTNAAGSSSETILTTAGKITNEDIILLLLRYLVTVLLCLLMTTELFQLFLYRWKYILSLDKWLVILQIVVTFISVFYVVDSIDSVEIMRHFSAFAILLAWLELLLLSGRLTLLSVQLEMLKTVIGTFLKFMASYFLLLIAFALSFYILFKERGKQKEDDRFHNPFLSLLTTIVMFAGEYEFSSLSLETASYTSQITFLLFVVLVAIVLFNLLNGLAVSDTEKIRKNGETLSLVARVKLISNIQEGIRALPRWITPSVKPGEEKIVIRPNEPNSIGSTELRSLLHIDYKKRQRSKKKIPTEHLEIWSLFTDRLCELEKKFDMKFEETQQILKQILSRQKTHVSDKTHSEN